MATSVGIGLGLTFFDGAVSSSAGIASLLAEALIPTRDGVVTVTSTATVDPITGSAVNANTANGRTLNVGPYSFLGAALRAERATTGVYGAFTSSFGLSSYTVAAGAYPSVRTAVEDTTTTVHGPYGTATALTDGVNYVLSAYVKRGNGTRNIQLQMQQGGNGAIAQFDLSALTVGSTTGFGTGSFVRASIRPLPSGFALIQMTCSATAWGGLVAPTIYSLNGNSASYLGDGSSSMLISGYQVELGEYATMPLGWDGSAGVSRVAQTNSWNQSLSTTAGTVLAVKMNYGWSDTYGAPTNPRMYNTNNQGILWYTPGVLQYKAWRLDNVAATNQVVSAGTSSLAGQQQIVIQRFDATSNRITVNGATVSSAAPSMPFAVATPMIIGNDVALGNPADGWVGLLLFSRALTDNEVNLLTAYMTIV